MWVGWTQKVEPLTLGAHHEIKVTPRSKAAMKNRQKEVGCSLAARSTGLRAPKEDKLTLSKPRRIRSTTSTSTSLTPRNLTRTRNTAAYRRILRRLRNLLKADTGTQPRVALLNSPMNHPQVPSSRARPLLIHHRIRKQLDQVPHLRSSRLRATLVNSSHSTQASNCTRSRTQSSRPSRSRRAICRLLAKLPLIRRFRSTNSNSHLMVVLRTFPITASRTTSTCSESPTILTSASSSLT